MESIYSESCFNPASFFLLSKISQNLCKHISKITSFFDIQGDALLIYMYISESKGNGNLKLKSWHYFKRICFQDKLNVNPEAHIDAYMFLLILFKL